MTPKSEALREQAEKVVNSYESSDTARCPHNERWKGEVLTPLDCHDCHVDAVAAALTVAARDAAKEALELAARVAETSADGSVMAVSAPYKALARHIAEHIRALAEPGKGDAR